MVGTETQSKSQNIQNSRQLLMDFWLENEKRLCDDWLEKQFSSLNSTIRIGSLFSGIGGIEHAFERLGLKSEILFAGDIDKFAKISYLENHHVEDGGWHDDINDFSAKKFNGKIDLLVGGSPCQAFSMVGKRKGMKDPRGKLFYEYVRILNECQPKVFIFENVKGLISHNDGGTWNGMKSIFEESGYHIHCSVLNSKNYGIPQHRERVFVVGFKEPNEDFLFPAGFPLEHTMQDFLEDYVESNYYLKEKGIKFVTSTKNRLKKYTQINGEIALCQKANQQFNWHGDFVFEPSDEIGFDEFVFDVRDVEEKYYLSDKIRDYVLCPGTKNFKTRTETDLTVARPLLQSMHKMHRAGVDNYVTHNQGRIRKLTPRECLRLMGFRDDFKIAVSDTQMYRQTGNSIVVDVLIAILKQVDITNYGI
jgi:DNA (cytosine-5)-methyltransferase 1